MNEHINPVIFVMGVSGSGKSTIGKLLSLKLSLPYFEGDEYHSPENIAKMSAAQPLTDIDRQVWLESLNQLAINQGKNKGCIIGCSALKEKYRKTLAKGVSQPVYFVFLEGNFEIISQRLQNRKGHFMPPALLQSQFEALQIPENAIKINILDPPEQIVNNIIQNLSH
ncbi:gluconokinase [Marivirga lumbricoides]|uniref:Gluconokinase n=1 Tax=Marivirga lumbricoides TaxID=1046115 RepID=A0ABQ1LA12_9BACT|nr:gluconokinase [Marivirga lumbricoides]